MARLLLVSRQEDETVPSPRKNLTLLLLAGACACAALSPRAPLGLDIAVEGSRSSHATVSLGFATLKLAFDSGQQCPNSDTCQGVRS